MRRRSKRSGRNDAAGFTLLEIMVSMLLLAVIVTASVSLLFINIRGWDALVADSERSIDEFLITNRLRDALRQLYPLVWDNGGERRLAFDGESDRVHFVSRAPLQYRKGGFFEYLLVRESDTENGSTLVLYYAPYYPDQTAFRLPEAGERRRLTDSDGGVAFSYWGSKRAGEELAWSERWERSLDNYPRMIAIRFEGAGEQAESQTEFVKLLIDDVGGRP